MTSFSDLPLLQPSKYVMAVLGKTNYQFILNLLEHPLLQWVPELWIWEENSLFAQGRVYAQTAKDYGKEPDKELLQLFTYIDESSEQSVLDAHTRRGVRDLPAILNNEVVASQIRKHRENQLAKILSICKHKNIPLALNMMRTDLVNHKQYVHTQEEFIPELSFYKKPQGGVEYRLKLKWNQKVIDLQKTPCVVLVNDPGWVLLDTSIVELDQINANLLKPFTTQNSIHIPAHFVQEYFNKFIRKIATKADIHASGFDMDTVARPGALVLKPIHDPVHQQFGVEPIWMYGEEEFRMSQQEQTRIRLHFSEANDVRVVKYQRDSELEQELLTGIQALQLEVIAGTSYFTSPPWKNIDAFTRWIGQQKKSLLQKGIRIRELYFEQYQLNTDPFHVTEPTYEEKQDWFDVKVNVVIGEQTIPFAKFVPYLRRGENYYPLPAQPGLKISNEYFRIPDEWFTQYRQLANLGDTQANQLRFVKSQMHFVREILDQSNDNSAIVPPTDDTSGGELNLHDPSEQAIQEHLKGPIPGLHPDVVLRPYQQQGIQWLLHHYSEQQGALLADDMGLGKTLQSISLILWIRRMKGNMLHQQDGQVSLFAPPDESVSHCKFLVILPGTLIYNWEKELSNFAPGIHIHVHHGLQRRLYQHQIQEAELIITTYTTVVKDLDILGHIDWDLIILDESQQLKNRQTKSFQAVNKLKRKCTVSLSGTPVENSLSDLWSQMQMINPGLLGSYPAFREQFQIPIENNQDPVALDSLRLLIRPYLLRRTKEEVASDLPPLQDQVYFVDMTEDQAKLYEKTKSSVRNEILKIIKGGESGKEMHILTMLMRLRQIANHPVLVDKEYTGSSGKYDEMLSRMETLQKAKHKTLIFSPFSEHIGLYKTWCKSLNVPYTMITGETSVRDRKAEIQRFQEDPNVMFFLITLKTGGAGLNLAQADHVIIADPWWNPRAEDQAIARAHRIGQTKPVHAIRLVTRDTVEEKMLRLHQHKNRLAHDILEGVAKFPFTPTDLEFLVE